MIKTSWLSLVRNLKRHRAYSFINILGLAIGIAACLLIMLYVRHELSYESAHEKADRIYRVVTCYEGSGIQEKQALTPSKVSGFSRREIPEAEVVTRMVVGYSYQSSALVKNEGHAYYENSMIYADEYVFDVFDFSFLSGNPSGALEGKDRVVITREIALRYFDRIDVSGEMLDVDSHTYEVSGVVENISPRTNIRADFIFSMRSIGDWAFEEDWSPMNYFTFVLLGKGASPKAYIDKLNKKLEEEMGESLRSEGTVMTYELQPLMDIHFDTSLGSDFSGNVDKKVINSFTLIAVFILLVASINYINLSTAKSEKRAKEVGLRKVLGAHRRQLLWQFYGETFFTVSLALVVAIMLAELSLPFFNEITGVPMNIDYFNDPGVLLFLMMLLVGVSVVAGSYPAIFLSSFLPVKALKGGLVGMKGRGMFRKILAMVQFSISVFLVLGVLVIYFQLNFMHHKSLGYNKDQVIVIDLSDNESRKKHAVLKAALEVQPDVLSVGFSNWMMSNVDSGWGAIAEGLPSGDLVSFVGLYGTKDLPETIGLTLKYGKGFREITPKEDKYYYIINEKGAKAVGFELEAAVGKKFGLNQRMMGTVVGVVDDFHFTSLRHEVEPIALFLGPRNQRYYMYLKVNMSNFKSAISKVKKQWEILIPERPFAYKFLEDEVAGLYENDQKTAKILILFTVLSIFVGCLGLSGLSAFMVEKRTRELGIRKVLGAKVTGIVMLLSREYLVIIIISNLVAWPAGYLVMNNWLDTFAYRIEVGWYIFILASFITLLVTFFTVAYQSVKAAMADPVKSLRYE